MISRSWIIKTMELFCIAENIKSLIREWMKQWNTELRAWCNYLGNLNMSRSIFQKDSLSLLLVLAMIPLSLLLWIHLLEWKQFDNLIHTVRIFTKDIRVYSFDNEEGQVCKKWSDCNAWWRNHEVSREKKVFDRQFESRGKMVWNWLKRCFLKKGNGRQFK